MVFCSQCGRELTDGDEFCSGCGASAANANNQTQRQTVYEGIIHKCPNCGEVLEAFTNECPTCGYEIRGTTVVGAVHEFAQKIEEIEAARSENEQIGPSGLTKTDERKISLIRSFVVPSNKEDIIEFMILAESNINKSHSNELSESREAVCGAWEVKFEQAYQKAKLLLENDSDFSIVEKIYSETRAAIEKREVLRKRNTIFRIIVNTLGGWAGLVAAIASVVIVASGGNGSFVELIGVLALFFGALTLRGKKTGAAETAVVAACAALMLVCSQILQSLGENASFLEFGGGVALFVIAVNIFLGFRVKNSDR